MTEAQNTRVVKDAYEAFGRGDIPAILAMLDPGIDWHGVIGAENIPTGGRRHGPEEVAKFFDEVADTLEFETFEPREFVAQGDKVVTLGHYTGRVKATGGRFDTDWVMVFTVREGRITAFQEFADSHQLIGAFAATAV